MSRSHEAEGPTRRSLRRFIGAGDRRKENSDAILEETLSHIREEDLPADVKEFHQRSLPEVDFDRLLRAARVAKNLRTYQDIARGTRSGDDPGLVQLSGGEKKALVAEQDSPFSEPGMLIVVITVSLAALLQGHVQSSINGAALYRDQLGLASDLSTSQNNSHAMLRPEPPTWDDWALGWTNATPFLASAGLGCWLALPISDRYGRKGSMVAAAALILISSLAMALVVSVSMTVPKWKIILALRVVNGIAMGIKAVNTPILASETALGCWRGSNILAWQLWVAFGIFAGFVANYVFSLANSQVFTLALIVGSPMIPSVVLLVALISCPESPRFYFRRGPQYRPDKAFAILCRIRRCELIALRDVYLLHKSIEQEQRSDPPEYQQDAEFATARGFFRQFRDLFRYRRLRNALISCSIVSLAQQLCGINILAFYSSILFAKLGNGIETTMFYSIGFGAVNFVFGFPAFRTIDTIGRRKWLVGTLPAMGLMMGAAALSFIGLVEDSLSVHSTVALVALFLYLHAALYSPGLGPIPFCLAAESFPLSHREIGCACAVSVNLLFAGLLSIFFPSLNSALGSPGCLGVFAGFNFVAFLLVFLFVEETRKISLEDLDFMYAVSKNKFWRYQVFEYLPWIFTQYLPWSFRRYVLQVKTIPSTNYDDPEKFGRPIPNDPPDPPVLYKQHDEGPEEEDIFIEEYEEVLDLDDDRR